jgi:hypothetical protein
VASLLKIGFWNVEDKVGNKDFVYCLNEHDMCRVAGSWTGGEVYGIEAHESCLKGNRRSAAFGRNPGGLSSMHEGGDQNKGCRDPSSCERCDVVSDETKGWISVYW